MWTISPTGDRVAAGDPDGSVELYDVASGEVSHKIPVGGDVNNLAFIDDDHLLVIPRSGPGYVVTVDVDELFRLAEERVLRTFTAEECERFGIDSCESG